MITLTLNFRSLFRAAFMTLAVMALPACQTFLGEQPQTARWWIDSARVDCTGVGPMTCYRYQASETVDPANWQLLYSPIEGFTYTPGKRFLVDVEIIDREPPIPADQSSKRYRLRSIISSEPDTRLRLTNIWKVVTVSGRDQPTDNRNQEPLSLELNVTQASYFVTLGCNRGRGTLTVFDDGRLSFGQGMSTLMACPDMTLEQAMTSALKNTTRYRFLERTLVLSDANGNQLMTLSAAD